VSDGTAYGYPCAGVVLHGFMYVVQLRGSIVSALCISGRMGLGLRT
jgi:hypothetical protein